jgi:hypothetical protein
VVSDIGLLQQGGQAERSRRTQPEYPAGIKTVNVATEHHCGFWKSIAPK